MCEFCEPVPQPPPSTEPMEGYAVIVYNWYLDTVVYPKLRVMIDRLLEERFMATVRRITALAYPEPAPV